MTKMRILICDDDERRVDAWRQALLSVDQVRNEFDVEAPAKSDVRDWIDELSARRKALRSNEPRENGPCSFDEADIVVVDYDLMFLGDDQNTEITAETVSHLARAFADCGAIVVLNQGARCDFDLTLKGHPESRADLNIPGDRLANEGLWAQPFSGFRPWYWPLLSRAAERQLARVDEIAERLDTPIFAHLGFPEAIENRISRSALAFLGSETPPRDVTFRQFVTDSGNGADARDVDTGIGAHDRIAARIAAARLSKWLERMVLASQDILVDAPHLIERMPFLLSGDRNNIESWQETVDIENPSGICLDLVEKYRFGADNWLSRPAFWWPEVDDDETIRQMMLDDHNGNPLDLVFREDVSNFGPRAESREFVAAFHSAFDRRWVAEPREMHMAYAPSVRFAI